MEAMSGLSSLFDKLEREPADEQRAALRDWVGALEDLRTQLMNWLGPGVSRGLLRLEPRTVSLHEPDFDEYEAPALDIFFTRSRRLVRVEPVGLNVVGVIPRGGRARVGFFGRVDLKSGAARATLLRSGAGTWQFVAGDRPFPSDVDSLELTEDSLGEVLESLFR